MRKGQYMYAALAGVAALGLAACDAPERDPRINMDEETVEVEAPAGPIVAEALASRDDMTTLNALIERVNMGPALEGARDMTLLAPTDAAFAAMDENLRAQLEEDDRMLRFALGYHLLRSATNLDDIRANIEGGTDGQADFTTSNNFPLAARLVGGGADTEAEAETEGDESAETTARGDLVFFDENGTEAHIVEGDIPIANGTIHVIDAVLLPPQR